MAQVKASTDYDEKAADTSDEKLRKAAGLLELEDLANADDIPQFLALAREASERATSLRPFDVQLLGTLGCCPARSPRWPPVRARRCPARSPPPGTRSAAGRCT